MLSEINQSLLFMYLAIGLAVFLTWFNVRIKNLLVCLCACTCWLALAFWFLTGAPLSISPTWTQMLTWVFFMLFFVPIVLQMDTEIIREKSGNRWSEYGNPKDYESTVSAYDKYKKELQRRTRR